MSLIFFIAALVLPVFFMLGSVLAWKYFFGRDRRRSPITVKLHHLPGEGLRKRIADLEEDLSNSWLTAAMAGPTFFAGWLAARTLKVDWSKLQLNWIDAFIALVFVGVLVDALIKFIRQLRAKSRAVAGLHAELAVAQGLNALLAEGCIVFHDIPGEGFNIDHVVIGPQAVFAIETKSRKKPEKTGRESAKVIFDGQKLQFPEHFEIKPLEQARAQARWLSNYLAGGAGESVKVIPVVALPGWFVESSRSAFDSDVVVNNCKTPKFATSSKFGSPMAEDLRRRIAHAIVQRYDA